MTGKKIATLSTVCVFGALAGMAHGEVLASTDFNGRTLTTTAVANDTATGLNWTLNGLEDPGNMAAKNAGGGGQVIFDGNAFVQGIFVPGINTGNGNTFWTTSVDLTVAAGSVVTLTDVTFDYLAVSGGQVLNVGRRSDFTFKLLSPSAVEVASVDIVDVSSGTNLTPQIAPVSATFTAPIALTEPGTYTLEIKGGDFLGTDETGNHTGIDNLSINGQLTSGSGLKLVITPNGTNYNFEWTSQTGKVYDLLSAAELSTAPDTWVVYDPDGPGGNDPYGDIPSAGEMTPLADVPGSGAVRFFAVVERNQPPLLSEDFEGVTGPAAPGDWSVSNNDAGTAWEVGVPSGVATGPNAAANGTQCAGTNIGAAYTASAETALVTKAFNVPASGATLSFSQYIDTEGSPSGDLGSIRLLNAADNTPLVDGDVALDLEGISEEWSQESIPLPAAANGLEVKIEFRFASDGDVEVFAGFYIDDVVVTAN